MEDNKRIPVRALKDITSDAQFFELTESAIDKMIKLINKRRVIVAQSEAEPTILGSYQSLASYFIDIKRLKKWRANQNKRDEAVKEIKDIFERIDKQLIALVPVDGVWFDPVLHAGKHVFKKERDVIYVKDGAVDVEMYLSTTHQFS
jgi:hypothetical protein